MERDIEALATYPTESDDWVITVLIGGVASLLTFLIIPIFAVAGYLVRAIRAGMEDADEPPVFDDWGTLLKEGVVAAAIGLVYQIIPIAVFAVAVGGSVLAILSGSETGAGVGLLGLVGGFAISWVLSILFWYVGTIGIANYAREGRFAAGFDLATIRSVVTSGEYLYAWLYVIALNFVVGVVAGLLNIIPFLGSVLAVFVGFYALVIAGWLWGDGFASATAPTETETPAGAPA